MDDVLSKLKDTLIEVTKEWNNHEVKLLEAPKQEK